MLYPIELWLLFLRLKQGAKESIPAQTLATVSSNLFRAEFVEQHF